LKTGGTSVPPVYFRTARRSPFHPQTIARQNSPSGLPSFCQFNRRAASIP